MTLICEAKYQGLPVKAWEFRRSQGLTPEFGWVDINAQDLKQIRIVGRDIPWRAQGGLEVNGQTDIRSWAGIKPGTTTDKPDLPQPSGGGLNEFGFLEFRTIDVDTGQVVDQITYHDIYVARGAMEEISENLAHIERHNVGTIRIPITDVRDWYGDCGGLWGGINCKLKSGEWDKTTIKDGESVPWSVQEVFRFLFSQLPGSPPIAANSELFGLSASEAPPPSSIRGEGELVVEHLQRLLDRYGLTAGMRPSGSYSVDRKGSKRFAYKTAPDASGNPVGIAGRHLAYEKRTVMVTKRPPAVCVTGPRRIRRVTVPYVPVLEDTDGRIYRMEAVLKRWGHSLERLNNTVLMGAEYRGFDIPPSIGRGGGGVLHEQRVKIARRAYHMYAPAFLFEGDPNSTTEIARGISDQDFDIAPYLPMQPAPYYIADLEGVKIPKDATKGQGDREEFVLLPPVARGLRYGTTWFQNFGQVESYFDALIEGYENFKSILGGHAGVIREMMGNDADALVAMSSTAAGTISASKLSKYGASGAAIEFDADTRQAAASVGRTLGKSTWDSMLRDGFAIRTKLKMLAEMAKTTKESIKQSSEAIEKWRAKFESFRSVYEAFGGIALKYNIPYGLLEEGSYSIDLNTGVLQASEPLCHADRPIFLDGDSCTVVNHGNVMVTFGYELKDNSIAAYTSFLFVASGAADDEPAKPVLAGVSRSSPVKAKCEPMQTRFYEMDYGTPCNLNAAFAEAFQKATAVLGQPKIVSGFIYTFSGMCNFPLAAGVSGVQHVGSGNVGNTTLTINAPGARAPLGPPMLPRRAVATVDTRENIERAKEK